MVQPGCFWPLLHASLAIACLVQLGGCVYDYDERCGPRRIVVNLLCVCEEGLVDQSGSCLPKPATPDAGAGHGDVAAGALGASCRSKEDCSSDFPECHAADGGDGYCTTTGCAGAADCMDDFRCATSAKPSFCRRPPTGERADCTSDADCASFDAKFCSVGSPTGSHCWVRDCTADTDCSPGLSCLDLSAFVPGVPRFCSDPM